MRNQHINRISGKIATILSALALLTVFSGYFQSPQRDEGTAAHIFQLSVSFLIPTILVFLATADWSQRLRSVRPLSFAATALILAVTALYYLEHYFYPGHYR